MEATHFEDNSFNSIIDADDFCKDLKEVVSSDAIYPEQPNGYTLNIGVNDARWVNDEMLDGRRAIVVRVCFAYKTMNELHHTAFCYFYRAGVTENPKQLNICTAGNHAD